MIPPIRGPYPKITPSPAPKPKVSNSHKKFLEINGVSPAPPPSPVNPAPVAEPRPTTPAPVRQPTINNSERQFLDINDALPSAPPASRPPTPAAPPAVNNSTAQFLQANGINPQPAPPPFSANAGFSPPVPGTFIPLSETASVPPLAVSAQINPAPGQPETTPVPLQIGSLDGSDRKYYQMSPTPGALEQFDQTYRAQTLVAGFNHNVAIIRDSEQEKDDRRAAVQQGATQVEGISAIDNEDVRVAALELVQPGLVVLGEGVDILDKNDTITVVGQLTRATENLGLENAYLIAEPVAHGLHVGTTRHHDNAGELSEGITKAIENGDGALFATVAANSLRYDPGLRNTVAQAGAKGIHTLNDEFNAAKEDKASLENEVAQYIAEFGDSLTEDELNAGIEAVIEKNQPLLDRYDESAAKLTTTFNAIALMPEGLSITDSNDRITDLWYAGGLARKNIPDALDTESGLEVLGNAIEEAGAGERNFYTEVTDFYTSAEDPANTFSNLVFKVTVARAASLAEDGDFDRAADLFSGFKPAATNLFQIDNPEKLDELILLLETQATADKLPTDEFARNFTEVSKELEGRAGVSGNTRTARNLQVLGLVIGGGALISDLQNVDNPEQAARALINASELGDDLASLLPEDKLASEALGNFGKLAKVGILFDTIDAYREVRDGNNWEAAVSITGLVGTILSTTSLGGPAGTAAGVALSLVAVGGSFAVAHHRKNQAEDRAEAQLGAFLSGAFSEDEVELLRDVRGDTHQSIGLIFKQIADVHPDLAPRDVIELLLHPGEHQAGDFYGNSLESGTIELTDNRRALIDQIENLERDENGNFTPESVRKAIVLFETQLGVNVRSDGLTTDAAMQRLENEFDTFDVNNDGQVSDDDLKDIIKSLDEQTGSLTTAQLERQQLAYYFLDRENLFHRLDNGGDSGSGNDKISRQDITDVREQNRHLSVIRENLDVFDVGKYPDSAPDGTISRTDLRRIKDGNYPQALKDAAAFMLDNDDFFNFVETGQQRAGLRDIGYGDIDNVRTDSDTTHADVHDAWSTLNG